MDAHQESHRNPFGMDPDCENCPDLCETRTQVVHGYGSVDADFLVVGEAPSAAADEAGVPFAGAAGEPLRRLLVEVGLLGRVDEEGEPPAPDQDEPLPIPDFDPDQPTIANCYLTSLTRCRHPERPPTDAEVANCEPFLNAEVRMINPEIIVPLGERALGEILVEYTTRDPDDVALADVHGEELRGRGFEIVPFVDPTEWTADQREAARDALLETLGRDYRQTKGRRRR